ncbi:polysaccharide lyase family 7 protein [Pseudomonas typographi]|uniref:polysaccharide lyase family 7 protein n=1 Tax=Pseudomonas typographi TaxID=2715964 RepID=UPI0016857B66|nr:polysaccharide lyase family 7 protein [Pseudomonas typographi]MBD1554691.1 polysaccharide lyase family 7 protein [Pseudomonas typographi]
MIDLSRWNWTGPKIDPKTNKLYALDTEDLNKAASAKTCVADQLNFGTDEYGDYIEFVSESGLPDTGTTEHTTYPRSELRETTLAGAVKQANWRPDSKPVHGLRGILRVMELAHSGKFIFGQFHGETDDPMLKNQGTRIDSDDPSYDPKVEKFRVYTQHRPIAGGNEKKPPVGPAIAVGQPFFYDFYTTCIGKLVSTVESDTITSQFDMESYYKKDPAWYRKAGNYSQEKAKGGTGRTVIRYYCLEMYEALPSSALPALTKTSAADPVSQPTPATPAQPAASQTSSPASTLADQITDAFTAWQAGTVSSHDTLVALNALSKQVASLTSDKDRAPLYAQINQYKAQVQK